MKLRPKTAQQWRAYVKNNSTISGNYLSINCPVCSFNEISVRILGTPPYELLTESFLLEMAYHELIEEDDNL